MNAIEIQNHAEQLTLKSDAWSSKFVGCLINNEDYLNLWTSETEAYEANYRAYKVCMVHDRLFYKTAYLTHKAFAESAWSKLQ